MIISASRRTDIPAFYSNWFINRLREGYILIPNPRNPRRLGELEVSPDNVDCIVFWTKNPIPLMDKLDTIDEMGYDYYFNFSLTPYGRDIEKNLPDKSRLVEAFEILSERIGPGRMVWRYDPIFIDNTHSIKWHIGKFKDMAKRLGPISNRCIISFIDIHSFNNSRFRPMSNKEIHELAGEFSQIAKRYDLPLYTCGEPIDLASYDILHASCIDKAMIEDIIGFKIDERRDLGQRPSCACIASVDIGVYDTCSNGCSYCYATSSLSTLVEKRATHDPGSAMLVGSPIGDEIITSRTRPSSKIRQLDLFSLETKNNF